MLDFGTLKTTCNQLTYTFPVTGAVRMCHVAHGNWARQFVDLVALGGLQQW